LRSKAERLMTLSTSAVAVCCSSASSRSRASRATSVFWATCDDARRVTALDAAPPLQLQRLAG
jgi:hypothetical protein